MKKLKINRMDFELAFEYSQPDAVCYLDSASGDVIIVSDESKQQLDELLTGTESLETAIAALERSGLEDWEQQELMGAVKVEFDVEERYLEIPKQNSDEGWREMEAFIDTISDERLQGKLLETIHRSKPFRHFKDALSHSPKLLDQWHEFENAHQRQRILDWLASKNVEPDFE